MPRNPSSSWWFVRLTATLTEAEEQLLNIPDTVIVYHHGGSRSGKYQEKPHYHCVVLKQMKDSELRELLMSNTIVQKYYQKTNGFYACSIPKPHYTLQSWWEYVTKDYISKRFRLIHWNVDTPRLPDFKTPEEQGLSMVFETPGTPRHIIVRDIVEKTPTSRMKQQRFLEHCKTYFGDTIPTQSDVVRQLIEYCADMGFAPDSSLSTWARFAYFNLIRKSPEFETSAEQLTRTLVNKFFD